jgi:hypothetical protein
MLLMPSPAFESAVQFVDEAGCSKDPKGGSTKTQPIQLRVAGRLKTLVLAGLRVPTTEQRAWQGGGAGLFVEGKGKVSEQRKKRRADDARSSPFHDASRVLPSSSAEAAVGGRGRAGRTTLCRRRSRSVALLLS